MLTAGLLKMEDFKLDSKLYLSGQRALLGMIYPAIRAISVGITEKKLFIKCYLDRPPNDDDYENLSCIAGEILSDFSNLNEVQEICEFNLNPTNNLDRLMGFLYFRKEN